MPIQNATPHLYRLAVDWLELPRVTTTRMILEMGVATAQELENLGSDLKAWDQLIFTRIGQSQELLLNLRERLTVAKYTLETGKSTPILPLRESLSPGA